MINLDGGTSGQFNFTVTAGVSTPAISSVSPNPVPGLNGNQTLTVTGSGFVSGAIVRLRDLTNGGTFDKTPTSLSGTQLQISANFTAAAATWSAQVINLDGGTSGQFNFTVTAGVSTPAISSVSPSRVPGLNGNQTLTVTGSGFVSGAIVRLRDLTNGGTFDKTPTSLSGTQLQISANFTAAAATWSAQVINLDGGTSGQFNFTVTAGVSTPAISSVSPNPVPGLNGNQTLTVTGSGCERGDRPAPGSDERRDVRQDPDLPQRHAAADQCQLHGGGDVECAGDQPGWRDVGSIQLHGHGGGEHAGDQQCESEPGAGAERN